MKLIIQIPCYNEAATLPGKVFHAGTRLEGGKVVTSGGRVLCVTALGHNTPAYLHTIAEALNLVVQSWGRANLTAADADGVIDTRILPRIVRCRCRSASTAGRHPRRTKTRPL